MPRKKNGPHPLMDKRVAVFVREPASGGWIERRPGTVKSVSTIGLATFANIEDRTGNVMAYNVGLARLIPDPEGEANGD